VLVLHDIALVRPSIVVFGSRVPCLLLHSVTSTTAFGVTPIIEQHSRTLTKDPTPLLSQKFNCVGARDSRQWGWLVVFASFYVRCTCCHPSAPVSICAASRCQVCPSQDDRLP